MKDPEQSLPGEFITPHEQEKSATKQKTCQFRRNWESVLVVYPVLVHSVPVHAGRQCDRAHFISICIFFARQWGQRGSNHSNRKTLAGYEALRSAGRVRLHKDAADITRAQTCSNEFW